VSSADLWARALAAIPGGVNSPVRAMKAVGLDQPLFAARGEGAYLEDAEGRRYVDWVMSWGPLIFGHADPETVAAVVDAARAGTTFGTATEREVLLPRRSSTRCRRSRWCGSSRPAPRRR
jgi:glutamate-1-semialdehyde 2,1-aminomutase